MRALGLDGFSKGWVAVLLDGDRQDISFHREVADALSRPFDRAGIDIPIGMTDDGERVCDLLAREKLRPHSSRVFTGARRWLWQEFSHPDDANREALRRGQKRVSRQLWHLGPKIMQVDAFMRANAARAFSSEVETGSRKENASKQESRAPFRFHRNGNGSRDVREVHPELVFLRLNGGKPLGPKTSDEGDSLRRRLLKQQGIRDIDVWLSSARIGEGAKRDDVLDACAVAIAARSPAGRVPEGPPPFDEHRLPMQIWF